MLPVTPHRAVDEIRRAPGQRYTHGDLVLGVEEGESGIALKPHMDGSSNCFLKRVLLWGCKGRSTKHQKGPSTAGSKGSAMQEFWT